MIKLYWTLFCELQSATNTEEQTRKMYKACTDLKRSLSTAPSLGLQNCTSTRHFNEKLSADVSNKIQNKK